jgi:hypothetical protein
MKPTKILFIICSGILLVLGFQNCSKGFEGVDVQYQGLSSQCQVKIQSLGAKLPIDLTSVDCEDPSQYFCEARVFSPKVPDYVENREECFDDSHEGSVCVETQVRNFNTSGAMTKDSDPMEFESGGQYNNVEVNCSHRTQYKGVAVFVGHADEFEKAFASAKAFCLQSKQGVM